MKKALVLFVAGLIVVALVTFAVIRTRRISNAAVQTTPAEANLAAVPRIEVAELRTKMDQNAVTVIDVRDIDAYTQSHIAGALHIPLSRVESEIPFFPKDKPIVFYCTCPHDEAAAEAVLILEHDGVSGSKALHGGLDAWTRLEHPIASGVK